MWNEMDLSVIIYVVKVLYLHSYTMMKAAWNMIYDGVVMQMATDGRWKSTCVVVMAINYYANIDKYWNYNINSCDINQYQEEFIDSIASTASTSTSLPKKKQFCLVWVDE